MTITRNHTGILEDYLTNFFKEALNTIGFDESCVRVKSSKYPQFGQFQYNGAMSLAKTLKRRPINIAKEIAEKISENEAFDKINVVDPGFINMNLSDSFLAQWCDSIFKDKRLGCYKTTTPLQVIFDFGGPNIAKLLHIGHIRSLLIGDCLQRVYRFFGDNVLSDIHLGDWGIQIGMLIEEMREMYPNLIYFQSNYKGEYPKQPPITARELSNIYPHAFNSCKINPEKMQKARLATAKLQKGCRGYRALWKHFLDVSILELKKDLSSLGVRFDLWRGESDAQPCLDKILDYCLKNRIAEVNQGSTIIRIAENKRDTIPPLILSRSDSAFMYGATDLGTILERIQNYHAEKIVYIVDKRQSLHFKQVFRAVKKIIGTSKVDLVHIGFGTVNGKDGRPFKTRSGDAMCLSELIKESKSLVNVHEQKELSENEKQVIIEKIALSTIKFADLSNSYRSDYIFDLDKFSQHEGKSGPYLLYTVVRIKSIMRQNSLTIKKEHLRIIDASTEAERRLQLQLTNLPKAFKKTYENCEPHHLCEYAYQLSVNFNKFYAESRISTEKNQMLREGRLALCKFTVEQLIFVLDLLGIETVERM